MNRCRFVHTALLGLSSALLLALAPAAAHAQAVQRNFPAKALRGSMVVVQPPLVAMDDRPTRFSPGSRILDTGKGRVALDAEERDRDREVVVLKLEIDSGS